MAAKLVCAKIFYNPYREEDKTVIEECIFSIDGYQIAERRLEGVEFLVDFSNPEDVKITLSESDQAYVNDFSKKKIKEWFDIAHDMVSGILQDGDEVEIPKYLKEKYYKDDGIWASGIEVE